MTDLTPEIFTALGITPEKEPWAYKIFEPTKYHDLKIQSLSLLSGTLEADGLAKRLEELFSQQLDDFYKQHGYSQWPEYDSVKKCYRWVLEETGEVKEYGNFSHAVHDALVEALGITTKEENKDE